MSDPALKLQVFLKLVNSRQEGVIEALKKGNKELLKDILIDIFTQTQTPYTESNITDYVHKILKNKKNTGGDYNNNNNFTTPIINSTRDVNGTEIEYFNNQQDDGMRSGLMFLLMVLIFTLACVVVYNTFDLTDSIIQQIANRRRSRIRINRVVPTTTDFTTLEIVENDDGYNVTDVTNTPDQTTDDTTDTTIIVNPPAEGGDTLVTASGAATIATMTAMVLACAAIGSLRA